MRLPNCRLILLTVLLGAPLTGVSAADPLTPEEFRLDKDVAKLIEHGVNFAKEGRHDLALILLERTMNEEAIFDNPPDNAYDELLARRRALQALVEAIRQSIDTQPQKQRVVMNARAKKYVDVAIATRGDTPLEEVRRQVAGSILCERGETITYEEAIAAAKRGEYRQAASWLYLLTVLGEHSGLPQAKVKMWLDAAEAGLRDPAAGEAAVKQAEQPEAKQADE